MQANSILRESLNMIFPLGSFCGTGLLTLRVIGIGRLPGKFFQWRMAGPVRLQLRGSGGITPRFPIVPLFSQLWLEVERPPHVDFTDEIVLPNPPARRRQPGLEIRSGRRRNKFDCF